MGVCRRVGSALAATMSLVLMSCTAVRAAPAAAAAPSRALRILRLSPDDGVYGKVPDLTVTFNQPVAVDSVHYATAVEEAAGRLTLVRNPVVTATARPDSVQLALGPLRPGPYSVVLGPSISSTQGALLGTADVFDFVYAPAPVAWQEVQTGQGRFTVWALASGERCGPRRDSYLVTSAPTIKPAYVRLLCASGHEQAVSALYATTASGVLVTSQSLTDQLVFDAEMQGWVLGAPVPAAGVLIAPATSQWAQSNGPGSPLLAALYAMAKASGATPERPPSRMPVYTTVLASGIADGGAPGEWHGQSQADLSAVARMLQGVNTVAEGVNLLVELVQTTSDLSVPGAEAVGLAVAATKAAGSGTQITWDSLAALTAVEVTARVVDAAAPAFTSVGRESPDPALAATIASLLQFRVQRVQAALAATYAASAATWSVYLRWFPLHGATALSSAASLTVGRPAASGGSTQGGGAAGRAFCVAVQRFASFFITRPTPLPQRSIAAAVTVGRGALATMRADAPMVLHADVDAFANAWRPVLATMVDPAGVSHATGEREARVLYTVMTGPIARVIDAWQGTHCAGALPWFRPATPVTSPGATASQPSLLGSGAEPPTRRQMGTHAL